LSQSFAAVSPVLNATVACQEISSNFLRHVNLILSQNFYHNIVLIGKNSVVTFHFIRKT